MAQIPSDSRLNGSTREKDSQGISPELTITDAQGETLTGRQAEDYAVTAINRLTAALNLRLEHLAKKSGVLAETTGAQDNSHSASNRASGEGSAQEKKKKERALSDAIKRALQTLNQYLDALEKQIAQTKEQIEQLQEEMDETETALEKEVGPDWKEKGQRGELKGNPLWEQYILQQQRMDGLLHTLDKQLQDHDEASKLSGEIQQDLNAGNGISPGVLQKIEKMAPTLEGSRLAVKAIENAKLEGGANQVAAIEALGFNAYDKATVTADLTDNPDSGSGAASMELSFDSAPSELSFDSPLDSGTTSFAQSLDGKAFEVASLTENFAVQAEGKPVATEATVQVASVPRFSDLTNE